MLQFRMSQVNRMSDNGKIKTETARQFMDTYILADTNKVKHRKNCESCQSQVTWKVKFKCPVLSCHFLFLLSILWVSNVVSSVVKFWWCGLKLVQFSPLSFLCRVSIMLDITRPALLQILAQRAIITSSKLFLLKEKVNCTQVIRQRG